ncbi:uncharacterized protein LOC126573459 [Anopheles aquasalis]|uniref:uncharacterized protein LOC126573459 n=1 Tax=Anopheles aquasalis TaxID=42839 RepID=UPI00215AE3D9|nr:uncharacterized protein LOC126573459 [Anopheles aquasalis]
MQAKNRCSIIVILCCTVGWLGPAQAFVLSDVMARNGRDQLQDTNATEVHRSSESSRLTFEFVIELNRLIHRLSSIPAADGPLSASKKAYATEQEWQQTEQRLEQLLQRNIKKDDHSNETLTMEHLAAASKAFRKHKKDFEGLLSSNDSRLRAVPLALAVNFAVEDLKEISIDLLHHLERSNGTVTNRAIDSGMTVSSFLAYFRRKIDDTKKAFVTQANLTLRRIKTRLAEVETTQALASYIEFLNARFALLKTTIMTSLEQAYTMVSTSLTNNGNEADTNLASGLVALLAGAIDPTMQTSHYLERCLTRFVYHYYEQSRALGKLLYCVQMEPDTLDSLVAITVPFLRRAVESDSDVTQLNFICSSPDSTDCEDVFLQNLMITDTRDLRYTKFEELIGAELTLLAERVDTCTSAIPPVMLQFTTDTQAKFTTCLSTGRTA